MDISMNKTTTKDRFLMVLNRTLLNSHRKSRFKMFLNFSNEEELTVSFNSFWFYWAVDRRHRICENLRTFLFLLPFEFERVWTTLTLSGITHFFRRIRSPSPSPPHPPTPPHPLQSPKVPVHLWNVLGFRRESWLDWWSEEHLSRNATRKIVMQIYNVTQRNVMWPQGPDKFT